MTETPKTFDLAGFISGATRPTRAVTVYGDGARLVELDRLAEQIAAEKHSQVPEDQQSMGDKPLRVQYAELWAEIQENALEVEVKGHTTDETRAIIGDRDPAKDKTGVLADEINTELIADAMVPSQSVEDVRALRNVIGEHQWKKIIVAYTKACAGAVGPDADFLPRASTRDNGRRSSQR